jgi:hypothetical protein
MRGSWSQPRLSAAVSMFKRYTKSGVTNPPIVEDRLATADEIRAADFHFPDPIEEYRAEILREIAADVGGYVRLSAVEIGTSLLVEELTQEQHAGNN